MYPYDIEFADIEVNTPATDLQRFPEKLINEENAYKQNKTKKLQQNIGGLVSFFSSDPKKEHIMRQYWRALKKGFEDAAQIEWDGYSTTYAKAALLYLTVIIQRYYDLEKGSFDWRGSEITRFEREYLVDHFGIILPRRVAKDESWETFVAKITENAKTPIESKLDIPNLKEHLKEKLPLSLSARPADIKAETQLKGVLIYPKELIDKENQYKNKKFSKLNPGAQEVKDEIRIFSSDPEKDKIMRDYWPALKTGFETSASEAKASDNFHEGVRPWIIAIIRRYYEMQKGHFDLGGSSINKFERQYLIEKLNIRLPDSVGKTETWQEFVGRIGPTGIPKIDMIVPL